MQILSPRLTTGRPPVTADDDLSALNEPGVTMTTLVRSPPTSKHAHLCHGAAECHTIRFDFIVLDKGGHPSAADCITAAQDHAGDTELRRSTPLLRLLTQIFTCP